jgi:Transposase DDE domain group 1
MFRNWFAKFKSRINRRLDKSHDTLTFEPVISASNIHYEVSDKTHAINCGGIGAIHKLAQHFGLIAAIDARLHLLKFHLPYQESDHVINIAYNALCGGTCLEDLELRRNDENYLNALGAKRIPDPTTAGDFCRRFTAADNEALMNAINDARLRVWKEQPDSFFDCARIDMDGSHVLTTGECKEGMDFGYNCGFCYHPLIVSLANTGEVLSIVNRPGNRPSHEGAALELERSIFLCLKAGFRKILLRGDTDFSQTKHLDGWNATGKIGFIFGYDAKNTLEQKAKDLPETAWRKLVRPARYQAATEPRRRPDNVKERIVKERAYVNLRLDSEDIAEFEYQPTACTQAYRMVVIRKNITKQKGEQALFDDIRYFFYITNERDLTAEEIVFSANDRCNQENLIAQLKSGVPALQAPVNTLESNGAYMVMTALAWNLKAWFALSLPVKPGRWQKRHSEEKEWMLRLEFKSFLNAFILLPCQIIKTGRKIVYRMLSWNPHLRIFFRLVEKLGC